ncbi:MAG: universal stress protein [Nitrospira sp.]|nr:universal stress protein [Nitrospira sp.]
MHIVIGIDWSDQSFSAVQQTLLLFRPTKITLVHGVDLGVFEYPSIAGAAALQGYEEFQQAMMEAGRELLTRTAALIPSGEIAVAQVREIGSPARIVLNQSEKAVADLIVMGARGRGRMTELILGSVSHRVLAHGTKTTLIVKGSPKRIHRALIAIEGREDAEMIRNWLTVHPFRDPVELSILTVIPSLQLADPYNLAGFEGWADSALLSGENLVKTTAASLMNASANVSVQVLSGSPAQTVAERSSEFDLLIVGSHSRRGVERFLLGSVSHSIVHHAACPVLVVR